MSISVNTKENERTPAQRGLAERVLVKFLAQFAYWGGGALMFLGAAEVIGAFGKPQTLDIPDPLLGVSFRYMMLAIGIIQLIVSFLLLFTNRRKLGLGSMAWISANFLAYRVGLWTMGWHHSSGFLFDSVGLSLATTDVITSLLSVLLFVGSCFTLLIERQIAEASEFMKTSCPACGGHITFASQNIGQIFPCPHCQTNITLRKPDLLKMSCFFCQEHVEFPPHAIGEKIPCPHCNMDITLKEPA